MEELFMDKNLFKTLVKWFGILILAHLASMLIFGLLLSSAIGELYDDEPIKAKLCVVAYNIVFDVALIVFCAKAESSYVDYRKSLKEALKLGNFSVINYFKTVFLKEHLFKIAIFTALQIPFVIFFAIFGVSLQYPILLEQFYYMDAGCYMLTGSAILGWLLNTILFGVIFTLIRALFIIISKKEIKKDMIM